MAARTLTDTGFCAEEYRACLGGNRGEYPSDGPADSGLLALGEVPDYRKTVAQTAIREDWDMQVYSLKSFAFVLAVAMGALMPSASRAEGPISFDGKVVTMIIPAGVGGGTAAVGRLLGDHLANHLPGKPRIVYRNMPAGGGMAALNYFVREVKPDGMTIVVAANAAADPIRFRRPGSQYNPATFAVVGGVSRGASLLIINKQAQPRLTDPLAQPVVMGAYDANRSGEQMALWGREYLQWNLKWVIGYPGTAEITLALQRGEIDMISTGNMFLINELARSGKFAVLAQTGSLVNGKLVPRTEFPDAMMFPEAIRPKLDSELARNGFDYWEAINAQDKWVALPEKTPKEIVEVYRTAFRGVAQDQAFLEQGVKIISAEFAPILPEDQEKLLLQVANTPDEALDYLNVLKRKQGLPIDTKAASE